MVRWLEGSGREKTMRNSNPGHALGLSIYISLQLALFLFLSHRRWHSLPSQSSFVVVCEACWPNSNPDQTSPVQSSVSAHSLSPRVPAFYSSYYSTCFIVLVLASLSPSRSSCPLALALALALCRHCQPISFLSLFNFSSNILKHFCKSRSAHTTGKRRRLLAVVMAVVTTAQGQELRHTATAPGARAEEAAATTTTTLGAVLYREHEKVERERM